MKAIIYCRRSPRPKHALERNESIETQVAICRQYCESQGLKVSKVITDEDRSGRTFLIKREGGQKLIELAPKVSNVVCSSIDRLFRNTIDGLSTLERWNKAEVFLHAVTQGTVRNISKAQDWLATGIALLFAEFEPRNGSERTSAAMLRRQANGDVMGGIAPYGLERDPEQPGKYRVCEAENEVRQMMGLMKVRGLTSYGIADQLNAQGLFNRKGKPWQQRSIDRILKSAT